MLEICLLYNIDDMLCSSCFICCAHAMLLFVDGHCTLFWLCSMYPLLIMSSLIVVTDCLSLLCLHNHAQVCFDTVTGRLTVSAYCPYKTVHKFVLILSQGN